MTQKKSAIADEIRLFTWRYLLGGCKITEAMGVDTAGMDESAYRKAAVDAVRKLSDDVGIPSRLEALKEEDLDFLAESAYADACCPGNPKDTCVEDLKELFRKLM